MKAKLELEPWNELFYKNCAYNPLFSGICYLGGSVLPFLANDFFSYDYNEENKVMKIVNKELQAVDDTELINQQGITFQTISVNDDIIGEIEKAIKNNKPVFTPIDRFNWASDNNDGDYYQKRHWFHWFLVYGYDNDKQKFNIIDVSETKNICFKDTIDYEMLVSCYRDSLEYVDSDLKMAKMYKKEETSKLVQTSIEEYKETYIINFKEQKDDIYQGLETIQKIIRFFRENDLHSKIIEHDKFNSHSALFPIIRAKKAQIYQVYNFFANNKRLIELLNKISKQFTIIKGLITKINYMTQCDETDYVESMMTGAKYVESIIERFEQAYNYEKKFYDQLLKEIE